MKITVVLEDSPTDAESFSLRTIFDPDVELTDEKQITAAVRVWIWMMKSFEDYVEEKRARVRRVALSPED